MMPAGLSAVTAVVVWSWSVFFQAATPAMSSREGVRLLIDNPRVTIAEISWIGGQTSPIRYEDDTLVVSLSTTPLKITTADGKSRTIDLKLGEIVFWPKGTTHTEQPAATAGRS